MAKIRKKSKRHPNTKRARARQDARQRAVEEANALHALDRMQQRRAEHVEQRRQLQDRLTFLEHQNAEWVATIKVMRECLRRLDADIISANYHIGELREKIDA